MKILPWILVLILAAGGAWFYTENEQKGFEITAIKSKLNEFKDVASELEELKSKGPQVTQEEIDRLRQENQEVYKLRAEVTQLRKEKTQWKQQELIQVAQAEPPPVEQPAVEQPVPEQEDEATRAKRERAMQCIANMRIIEDGKTKWAESNGKNGGDAVTLNDISPYLPNLTMPVCPDNGTYNLNEIGIPVSCTVEGHSLLP